MLPCAVEPFRKSGGEVRRVAAAISSGRRPPVRRVSSPPNRASDIVLQPPAGSSRGPRSRRGDGKTHRVVVLAAIKQKYDVNIEGTIYGWSEPTITAPQIRGLGGFEPSVPIIEVDLKDNSERTLGEGERVELRPGIGRRQDPQCLSLNAR
jgi:hypothetical protein